MRPIIGWSATPASGDDQTVGRRHRATKRSRPAKGAYGDDYPAANWSRSVVHPSGSGSAV